MNMKLHTSQTYSRASVLNTKERKSSLSYLTGFVVSLLVLFYSTHSLASQAIATVSKNNVAVNEVFQLMISIDKRVDANNLDLSVLESDFNMGRPSVSSYQSSINGKTQIQTQWTLPLAATKEGTIIIPSFRIEGSDTQPIALTVSQNTVKQDSSDFIELTGDLSKARLYEGESATFDLKLLIKADPRRLQSPSLLPPQGTGLDIIAKGEANQYQTVVQGIQATVLEQTFVVTPNTTGDLLLEGARFEATLIQSQGRYNANVMIPLKQSSGVEKITVLPKPASYQGTWLPTPDLSLGQVWHQDNGQLASTNVVAGEPITRTLVLKVKGIPQERLPNLVINYPDSVRVYDEKPTYGEDKQGNTVMTIQQVIIPRSTGSITLPEVKINWWNSQLEKQEVASASALTLTVSPAEQANPILAQASEPATANATAQVEVRVEKDAGYWPYVALFFALCWLATLAVLWRVSKKQNQSDITSAASHVVSNHKSALISSLEKQQAIEAQHHFNAWLKQFNGQVDNELKKELQEQMTLFMATQYASQPQEWQSETLIKLINHAEKHNTKTTVSGSALEKVTP